MIYTTGVRRGDLWDSGSWAWKNNRSAEDVANKTVISNFDGNEIMAEIAPGPRDIVVYKQKPSGFFGTNMASYLTLLGCDSVIVTGTTTSGCVRATVLDAFSLNYRITLAEEGCFDRSQASHAINLCDMNAKYADVIKTAEVLAFFDTLPGGLFDLPKGVADAQHPSDAQGGEFLAGFSSRGVADRRALHRRRAFRRPRFCGLVPGSAEWTALTRVAEIGQNRGEGEPFADPPRQIWRRNSTGRPLLWGSEMHRFAAASLSWEILHNRGAHHVHHRLDRHRRHCRRRPVGHGRLQQPGGAGQRVSQAFADIDVQLRQRHDLIPNLVETVKGYATHERGTLEAVVQARTAAVGAQGQDAKVAAETQLSGALGKLFALAEAYPDLKANTNFQQLQSELSDIENKLAAARRFFNNAVSEYNARIQQFPAALFAASLGFSPRTFFDLGDDRKAVEQAPQVKF